uniref:Epidermal differentiation-specific protein n=1 Tax=Callorhinchus milii TaxID=7868 RepID=V9L9W3_CALMI
MARIILYDQPFFTGSSHIFTDDIPDLATYSFTKKTRSMKVERKPWVAFLDIDYTGGFKIYDVGDYTNLGEFDQKIQSLMEIRVPLENPEIVLYQDVDYQGKKVSISQPTQDITATSLSGKVSSYQVKSGAWSLYKGRNFQGESCFTVEDQPDLRKKSWNDQLLSLQPVPDIHNQKAK